MRASNSISCLPHRARQAVTLRRRWCAIASMTLLTACGGGGHPAAPPAPPAPPAVASVGVEPGALTLEVGRSSTLTATARDASGSTLAGRAMAWSSSAPEIVSVASGTLTAVAPGTATITASSEGRSGTASITVVTRPVASVVVTPDSATLEVGATRTLVAAVRDADGGALIGRAVTWTSSTPAIATVTDEVVTAVAPGRATITATSESRTGTAVLDVVPIPVASVALDRDSLSVITGATATLVATVRLSGGERGSVVQRDLGGRRTYLRAHHRRSCILLG